MKTTFRLREINDDLDKIRLMLTVAGAKKARAVQNVNLRLSTADLLFDLVPMPVLCTLMYEGATMSGNRPVRPNTLLVSAGCKGVLPLAGCLYPSTEKEFPDTQTGIFAPISCSADLLACFPGGDYTAYVDANVLEEGPAGWRMDETDIAGGPKKVFTLTKDGKHAVLELLP